MPRFIALSVLLVSLAASAGGTKSKKNVVGIEGTTLQPFVGVSAGVGAVTAKHPQLSGFFGAPGFSLNVGLQFRAMWVFGFEVSSLSRFVAKSPSGTGTFEAASGAACASCESNTGGQFYSGSATFPGVGPRIDFSPMGETSPFISVAGGVVFTQGAIGDLTGQYIAGRLGFRYRFAPRVEASADAGYQHEWFPGASLRNVFGNLMIRAYF